MVATTTTMSIASLWVLRPLQVAAIDLELAAAQEKTPA